MSKSTHRTPKGTANVSKHATCLANGDRLYSIFIDICKLVLFFAVCIGVMLFVIIRYGLILNTTASYPIGIYSVTKQDSYSRGELVVACPPDTLRFKNNNRDIIPTSHTCPSGTTTILKKIVAEAGDDVFVGYEVFVNDIKQPKSIVYSSTSKDKELFACFGEHRVGQDEVWMMSDYEVKSFDSRYFCAVPRENIVGGARLVLRLPGQRLN